MKTPLLKSITRRLAFWSLADYCTDSKQLLRGGATTSANEPAARRAFRGAVRNAITSSGTRCAGDAGEWAHIVLVGQRPATGSLLASVSGRSIPTDYPAALHTLHGSPGFCDSAERVLGDLPMFRSDGDWHNIRQPLTAPLKRGVMPDVEGLGKPSRAVCIIEDARGLKTPAALAVAVEVSALGYATPAAVMLTDDAEGVVELVALAGLDGQISHIAPALAAVVALPRV